MRPLTLDDLLPLSEYAGRRRECFDALVRYLDRYRRVRVGSNLTLLFENRQTLWFRVQEILRVARLNDPERVQQELDLYNRLLPGRDGLQAALVIDIRDETRLTEELAAWQTLRGEEVCLWAGDEPLPATLVTCRPEDLAIGAAHWLRFGVSEEGRRLLGDWRVPARVVVTHAGASQESPPLSEEVRQSLLDDLAMSERD